MIEMDQEKLMQTFGLAGFAAYMSGYVLLQMGRICGRGNAFRWFNLIGASLMLVSLWHSVNLGAMLIQVSWIVVSLIGFLRPLMRGDYMAGLRRAVAGTR